MNLARWLCFKSLSHKRLLYTLGSQFAQTDTKVVTSLCKTLPDATRVVTSFCGALPHAPQGSKAPLTLMMAALCNVFQRKGAGA